MRDRSSSTSCAKQNKTKQSEQNGRARTHAGSCSHSVRSTMPSTCVAYARAASQLARVGDDANSNSKSRPPPLCAQRQGRANECGFIRVHLDSLQSEPEAQTAGRANACGCCVTRVIRTVKPCVCAFVFLSLARSRPRLAYTNARVQAVSRGYRDRGLLPTQRFDPTAKKKENRSSSGASQR